MSDGLDKRAANAALARELIASITAAAEERECQRMGRPIPKIETPMQVLERVRSAGPVTLSDSARKSLGLPILSDPIRQAAE